MRISVAMCTYNGARYVGEQLESIAAQTRPPDELVVCDDRSWDGTKEIVDRFARAATFPVRWFLNEQNLGPAKNFEKAVTLCRQELIALSDQDDAWYPEKLARLSGVLEADATLGGVFSDATLMDESSVRSGRRLWARVGYRPPRGTAHVERPLMKALLKRDVVTGATLMFRADMREVLLPVPDLWMHDGWMAWMLVLYSGIAAVDEPLIAYRVHDAQHAGLSPGAFAGRVERARQTGRSRCLATADQFGQVRAVWMSRPGDEYRNRLRQLEQKIDHLRYRANLPGSFPGRLYRVAAEARRYHRYGNGIAAMCKDILVQ